MLITKTPQEAQELIKQYNLKPITITSTLKTGPKPVYDVTLKSDDIPIPKSIITNGIVTHNSTEPNYLESILQAQGIKASVKDVFGVRNPKTSKWMIQPKVRLYSESIAERFFDATAKLLRALPDKILIGDEWYYVYDHTKENISLLKNTAYDKSFYQKTGKMRIPAENSLPQALIIVDSYPAMLPESQDVDDPKSSMAMQAIMFSKQIVRIKGKMKSKKVTIVGMNQLRDKPMVMYGSPTYEPGGHALRFFSDVRVQLTAKSNINGKGKLDTEPSYNGDGEDKYRYISAKIIKNKLSTASFLETMMRVWVEDASGKAHGFDLVWDTYQYLLTTGQIEGRRNNFKVIIPQLENCKALKWNDFKTLIIGTREEMITVFSGIGCSKPFLLRKFCKKQLSEGDGLERYFENVKKTSSTIKDDN